MGSLSDFDPAKFSDLVGLIYDAANNPELWPELLANLDEILAAEGTTPALPGQTALVDNTRSHIDLLRTHFQRALELNNELFRVKAERDAISSILDRLPIGVILVNVEQRPVAMNHHARKMIEAGHTLIVRGDKLVSRTSYDSSRLKDLIENAATSQMPATRETNNFMMLATASGNPCSLWVAPSRSAGIRSEEGLAAIFIASSEIRQTISSDNLASMYHLTLAEGRLLEKLVNGCDSLSDAADELKVSKHTVRSQMKTIFEKTGTHSQVELVKKVLSGPAALVGKQQRTEIVTDLKSLNHEDQDGDLKSLDTYRLHDGRIVEYAEYGDPNGRPVIFLHSLLHSRKRLHPFSRYAEENSIRIIAPERPGFGYSDFRPELTLADYADDIRQLGKALELGRFDVVGDASGAPYALACAAGLADAIGRVAIISCIPCPDFDNTNGLIPFERMLINMGRTTPPSFHRHFAKIMMKGMQRDPEKYFNRMFKHLPDADQAIVSTQEKREIFIESIDNAFPNRVESFVTDYLHRLRPWEIALDDIRAEVHLWHGEDNRIVNIESARKLAAAIPHCRTRFLEGHGHYLFISHWDQILEELAS